MYKMTPKFLLSTSPIYTTIPPIEIYRVVLPLLATTPWWHLVATWVTPPHRNADQGESSQPPLPSTVLNLPPLTYLAVYFKVWTVALAAPEWHSPLNSNVWHPTPTDVICGIIENVAPDLKWSPSTWVTWDTWSHAYIQAPTTTIRLWNKNEYYIIT